MLNQRDLGSFSQGQDGPLFIVLAGIHGNEHFGVDAVKNVFEHVQSVQPDFRGTFIGVAGNLTALLQNKRYIDLDLNRQWYDRKIEWIKKAPKRRLSLVEDIEQKELITLLQFIENRCPHRPIVMLDLHTTSAEGGAFCLPIDNKFSRSLSLNTGIPSIIGIEKVLKGTTLNYFSDMKYSGFGFEAGQHINPISFERMKAVIWVTLLKLDMLDKEVIPDYQFYKDLLDEAGRGLPKQVRFQYRHEISRKSSFTMLPGYQNFQKINKGQLLAQDDTGPIKANRNGMILMPLYQKQGSDGFFIVD